MYLFFFVPSITTSQLSSVWMWAVHTRAREAHRELCSFGCSCMMDIWKLNWLMAPPSLQPAGRPLAELRVCVCGGGGVLWNGGGGGTIHLASQPATDNHPCWTFREVSFPNNFFCIIFRAFSKQNQICCVPTDKLLQAIK